MKHLLRLFALTAVLAMLAAPSADAQRHNGAGKKEKTEQRRQRDNRRENTTTRPGRGSKPSGGKDFYRKPSMPSQHPATGQRPDNDKHPGGSPSHQRPGNRPDNDKYHPGPNNGHRPDNGHRPGNGYRPGGNHRPAPNYSHRPDYGHRPGPGGVHRPSPGHGHRPPMIRPPHRPYRPVMRPYRRPVPPPYWRPARRYPAIRTVLGISFGTAFGLSLDYLYGNGYTVDGYGDNMVYLRNVSQLNYLWPDATLYYGPSGLMGSEFVYSTSVYDPSRYNYVYRDLVNAYGAPATLTYPNGGYLATWFTTDNGYIRLQFGNGMSTGGGTRFYTSLSFGN